MNTFISGLTSVLTPSVFPFLIIIPIIFEKLGNSDKKYGLNILFFGILTVVFFLLTTSSLVSNDDFASYSSNFYFELAVNLFQIIFLTWFILSFFKKFERINRNNLLIGFTFLGIGIFSYKLALSSLSSIGPILGMVMISGNLNEELNNTMWLLFTFSLGVIFPFIIILYLAKNQYEKINSKRWWKILQIIISGILLLKAFIGILYYIMILNTKNLT